MYGDFSRERHVTLYTVFLRGYWRLDTLGMTQFWQKQYSIWNPDKHSIPDLVTLVDKAKIQILLQGNDYYQYVTTLFKWCLTTAAIKKPATHEQLSNSSIAQLRSKLILN